MLKSTSQVGLLNAAPSSASSVSGTVAPGKIGGPDVPAVRARLLKLLERPELCAQICAEGFRDYDRPGQGLLGQVEAESLAKALAFHLKIPAPRDVQFTALFEAYDDSGEGLITCDQFSHIFEVSLRYAWARLERGEFDGGRSSTVPEYECVTLTPRMTPRLAAEVRALHPQDVGLCTNGYSDSQYMPSDKMPPQGRSSPSPAMPPTPLQTPSTSYAALPRPEPVQCADAFEPVDWRSISWLGPASPNTRQRLRLAPGPAIEQSVATPDSALPPTPPPAILCAPTTTVAVQEGDPDDFIPVWTGISPRMRGGAFPAGLGGVLPRPQPGDNWRDLTPSLPPTGDLSRAATPHASTSALPISRDRGRDVTPRVLTSSFPPVGNQGCVATPHLITSSLPPSHVAAPREAVASYSSGEHPATSAAQVDVAGCREWTPREWTPRNLSSERMNTPVLPAAVFGLSVMAMAVMM